MLSACEDTDPATVACHAEAVLMMQTSTFWQRVGERADYLAALR